jgi:hypothetical protein
MPADLQRPQKVACTDHPTGAPQTFFAVLIMDLITPSSRRKKKVSGWLRINFTGTGKIYFADE